MDGMALETTRYRRLALPCMFWLIAVFTPIWTNAQLLPPNQPEQDACNAIELCGSTFTSTYSYQGVGLVRDLSSTPCGSGEINSVWLKVTIQTAGKLLFLLKPINIHDDYDFAVVKSNGNCQAISSGDVVRCNFNNNYEGSNVNGIIGLSATSNEPFVQNGTFQHSFSEAIDAQAGEVYYVMINNFGSYGSGSTGSGEGNPSAGFTIDFSESTATFANTTIPLLDHVVPGCDLSKSVTVHLSNYALCGSVASDGSDFTLTDEAKTQTYPIQSAAGVNCSGTRGYARDIVIGFQERLPSGNYTIQAKKGTDGNAILGLCGGETPGDAPGVSFVIKLDTLKLVSIDSPACQKIQLVFDKTLDCSSISNDGSQFYVTGPSSANVVAARPSTNCLNGTTTGILLLLDRPIDVDGLYTLHSKTDASLYSSCNSRLYEDVDRTFNVHSFDGFLKTIGDTTVCRAGDSIQLATTNYTSAPNGGFQYLWTWGSTHVPNTNTLSPWIKINAPTNHYTVETVDQNGCVLRDSVNVRIETFTGTLEPLRSSICLHDTLQLKSSGNAVSYHWFQDPSLTTLAAGTFSSVDVANPVYHSNTVGQFDYYLLMRSYKQCFDTLSTHIEVKPLPDLQLAFHDTVINYGSNMQLSASGADYYSWTPTISMYSVNTPNPVVHPLSNTTYTVVGTNQNSCHIADTVRVNIFFTDYAYFPTAFTPNQDGKNDVFRARFFGKINRYVLNIYNRWGQKVFSSDSPEEGWNGHIKNTVAPSGTYVWECIYQPDGQKLYDKKGTVVLIR